MRAGSRASTPSPEVIIAEARRTRDLEGVGVLVTAGPTREAIDPVRFLSNASSGKTGYAIADEAARRGARVTLVSGPTTLPDPFGVHTVRVTTAEQMRLACVAAYPECDVLVAAAAVSDFRPVEPHAHKQDKASAGLVIETERTADILAELAARQGRALRDRIRRPDARSARPRPRANSPRSASTRSSPTTFRSPDWGSRRMTIASG